MNYRRIQYFLAVVDAGTVTAAAEELHIAQPALSRQIKTLERELKLRLFETRGNRLVLTQAGSAYVPLARGLMAQSLQLEEAVVALRTGHVSNLVAAATAASVRGFLAPFIATTGPDDPLIITRETSHFNVGESLLHGADFMVSPAPPESGLHSVHLGNVPLKAYVRADHPWSSQKREEIPLEELCASHLILPSHRSVSRYILDDALSQSGLKPSKVSECDDGPTILALAAAGHGIGVTTEMASFGTYAVPIVAVARAGDRTRTLQLSLHAAWMPSHYAAESISAIAVRLKDFLTRQSQVLSRRDSQLAYHGRYPKGMEQEPYSY